jgi:protein SCO1/2
MQRGVGWFVRAAMLVVGVATLAAAYTAAAHDGHRQHHDQAVPSDAKPSAARVTLHDSRLVTVNGQVLRFKSEAVDNGIAVIGFIYTSCSTICPVTSAVLADVQDLLVAKLGERFGHDVKIITLTVDPATDTPERLKDYAESFRSTPGWLWLTGEKPEMDRVLNGLGAYVADITKHSAAVLVGDARSGDWTRLFGIPNPSDIVDRVEQLLAAREGSRASAKGDKS